MVALKTSSRSWRTTSPTTLAENHCWIKLKNQLATPNNSTPPVISTMAAVEGFWANKSSASEIRIGPPVPATAKRVILTPTTAICRPWGRK